MFNLIFYIAAFLINFSSLVYILLIIKSNKIVTNKKNPENIFPHLAVIIPFFNEEARALINTLESIEGQDYEGIIEILLIDDGSKNDSAHHVQQWLSKERRFDYQLHISTINSGRKGKVIDKAMSFINDKVEIVVIIDSDTVIMHDAIKIAVNKLLEHDKNVACCGFIIPQSHNFLEKLQYHEHVGALARVKAMQSKMGKVIVTAGAFSLHRVSAIKEIGSWGEWLVEDISWTWKALVKGYRVIYAEDALSYTICPKNYKQLFRQRRRWTRGRLEALKVALKVSIWNTTCLLPWLLVWLQTTIFPSILILLFLKQFFWLSITTFMINTLVLIKIANNVKHILFAIMLEIINIPANILGIIDEILHKDKKWLTRTN